MTERSTTDIIKDIGSLAGRYGPGVAGDILVLLSSINAETPRTEEAVVIALDLASAEVEEARSRIHGAHRLGHATE